MTLRTLIAAFVIASAAAASPAQTFDPQRVADDIASGETDRVQNARDDAVEYLGSAELSVSDRLAAVSALDAAVAQAAQHEDEFVVANALLIAGQFVTPSGFQLLTDHLTDDRPGVRYAAYRAMRSAFAILADQSAPSLQPAAAQNAFAQLVEAARAEDDPNTLESAYRAVAEVLTLSANPLKPLEAEAGATLAGLAGGRVAQLGGLSGDPYELTLGSTLYVALEYRRLLGTAGRRIDDRTARAAAALAGELVGHTYAEYDKAGGIDEIGDDRRELLAQTLAAAESLAYLALSRMGSQATETDLAGAFRAGEERDFRAGAFRLIGPAGTIPAEGIELENAPAGG